VPPQPSEAWPQSSDPHAVACGMRAHASGWAHASLISAKKKNVLAFARQS
jgi:hypothetical protein